MLRSSSSATSRAPGVSRYLLLLGVSLLGSATLAAAQAPPGTDEPADHSVTRGTDRNQVDAPMTSDSALGASSAGDRQVSLPRLIPNILQDQKSIWSFPLHVMKGEHVKPTFVLVGATAGLVA